MSYPLVVKLAALRQPGDSAAAFEGHDHDAPISFFDVDMSPGNSVPVHRHPYVELWIVIDGEVSFTVDDISATSIPGEVVIVPAGTAHGFRNTGANRLRMTCIHASDQFITEWL